MKQIFFGTTTSNCLGKCFSFLVRAIIVFAASMMLGRHLMIFDTRVMESMEESHNIDNETTPMKPPEKQVKGKRKADTAVKEYRQRVQISHKKLNDEMGSIRRENSDQLPSGSYFGDSDQNQLRGGTATVVAFGSKRGSLKVLPNNKLITCLMAKNMSTIMRAILCYLNDPVRYRATGRPLNMAFFIGEKICKDESSYALRNTSDEYIRNRFGHKSLNKMLVEWKPFVIVRDPIDRFLSAYVDKCIRDTLQDLPCNGCRHNMTCFIITEYERMRRVNRERAWHWTPEDIHFFPQNWCCAFRDYLDRYELLRYNSDVEPVVDALRRRGVSTADIEFIHRSLDGKGHRTVHKTADSEARDFLERRLRGNRYLLELLVEMFYWDFRLLGFPLPEISDVKTRDIR